MLNYLCLKKLFLEAILFQMILILTVNSQDRTYLYKYSKLYNSYKFDTIRPNSTETDLDPKNCLVIQLQNNNNPQYKDIVKCGYNIVDSARFEFLKNSDTNFLKKESNYLQLCQKGFITLAGSYIACSYPQRSKWIALMLEILGLGFGHLYIGKHLFFFAKFLSCLLFCYMIVCVIFFVGAINGSNVSEETSKSSTKIVKIIFPLIYVLYFIDIIAFASGSYVDEYRQPLY